MSLLRKSLYIVVGNTHRTITVIKATHILKSSNRAVDYYCGILNVM